MRPGNLLCEQLASYRSTTKSQVTGSIVKFTSISALLTEFRLHEGKHIALFETAG